MAYQAFDAYRDAGNLAARLEALMPRTRQRGEDELTRAATNKYAPIYNAQVEGAQQQQQSSDLALAQQIDRLMPAYTRQIDDINQSVAQGQSAQNRQALSRGMQRSSYNNAALAGIAGAGTKQIALAGEQYGMNVGQINAQRAQLEQQLAQTLNRLETDKQMNIAGYTDEMRQQDYQNAFGAWNALQGMQTELSRQEWHDVKPEKSGRGGGGGKKNPPPGDGSETDPVLQGLLKGHTVYHRGADYGKRTKK